MNKNLIRQSNGRIFTCEFIKKDGSLRKLNGRTGVRKELAGTGLAFSPQSRGMEVVYDLRAQGYRMVAIDKMVSFKCGGLQWQKAA